MPRKQSDERKQRKRDKRESRKIAKRKKSERDSNERGKAFELAVGTLLGCCASSPHVQLTSQYRVYLNDGRAKTVDFLFEYQTYGSRNQVVIECQDREAWGTEIVDKIQTIRNHSKHNRFWFVYSHDDFLSRRAKSLLDDKGIMHFSIAQLTRHLPQLARDFTPPKSKPFYDPPPDASSTS